METGSLSVAAAEWVLTPSYFSEMFSVAGGKECLELEWSFLWPHFIPRSSGSCEEGGDK